MIEEASNSNVRVKPKKTIKVKLLIAGGFLISAIWGYVTVVPAVKNWSESELSYSKDRIRTAKVIRGTFERSVASDGKIVAVIKPALFAPDDGRISLMVQPGDSVTEGDILAIIENQDLLIKLQQAKSDLQNIELEFERISIDAKRQIEEAEQELDYNGILVRAARRNHARHDEAYSLSLVSLQQYEEIKDELMIAESKYASLKSKIGFLRQKLDFDAESKKVDIQQKRVVVQDFQRQVDGLTIRSPINGQVGAVKVSNKDYIKKNVEMMSVVDLSAYGVELFVSEAYANNLSLGMEAVVNYELKQLTGVISAISPEIIGDQIEVRVKFNDGVKEELKQNQRVAVSIVLERIEDVIKVERGPFINTNGGRLAYVLDGDIARSVPIQIGAVGVSEVEIISGLNAGDTVIVSNTAEFNNASSVLLVK